MNTDRRAGSPLPAADWNERVQSDWAVTIVWQFGFVTRR
jgi:hypothetical protein